MKLSVITVCLNSVRTIGHTLESIGRQDFANVEHIVVDGASSDGTVDLVKRSASRLSRLISEPDRGLYNAMNKGIRAATGDYVGFLNSDDIYANPYVLSNVAKALQSGDWDAAHGDLLYVRDADPGKVVRYWKSQPYRPGMFEAGWHPAHPTLFVRRLLLCRLEGFDTRYRFHADFDLMVRLFIAEKISSIYLPQVLVHMRTGGHTNRSLRNVYRGNRESYAIARRFGVAKSPFWIPRKLAFRVGQFFKRPPRA